MKYCLYALREWVINSYGLPPDTPSPIHNRSLPRVMHSGLTNWARVFDGVYNVPMSPKEYEDIDILHINMTPNGVGNIHSIMRHLEDVENKPMIVVNVDHAIEMWNGFKRFDIFLDELSMADRVFCVEPASASTLKILLGKKVWCFNHPTNTTQLREIYGTCREEDPFPHKTVLVYAHPYDRNYLITSWVIKRLKAVTPDLRAIFIGQADDRAWLRTVYDEVYESVPFPVMMEIISRVDVAVDTAVTHSGGRFPAECAAVGTPCISDKKVFTGASIHGNTGDIYNGVDTYERIKEFLSGGGKPMASVEHMGYEASRKKFEEMISET